MTIQSILKHPIVVYGTISIILLLIIALIDFIGVQVIDYNGLVFEVHIYWMGLSYWVASAIYSFATYKLKIFQSKVAIIFIGLLFGMVWWFTTFYLLMAGLHGTMGGWY